MSDAPLPSLTIGGARVLATHLSAPGWCKEDLVKAYRAGSLSKRIRKNTPTDLPKVRDGRALTPEEGQQVRDWLDSSVTAISLSERDRELSREAIGHFAKAAQIELNDDLVAVMDAIGMKPEAV